MSSILKALKRLEDEKTPRRPALLHIDSAILRPCEEKRRFSAVGMSVMALLLFIGGSVATYLLMTRLIPSPAVPHVSVQQPTAPAPRPAVSKPQAIPVESLPAELAVMPATPAAASQARAKQPQLLTESKVIRQVPTAAVHQPKSLPDNAAALPQATATEQAVPQLRINGIAFQKEGADTMAIVNGVPVSIGAMVEGARVEEIAKDRVRFRYHGETLEILLGQSNR